MSNQAALDAVIATIVTDVAAIKTAVDALVAAIPTGNFTQEIADLQGAITSLEATTGEVQAATPPPPPPGG